MSRCFNCGNGAAASDLMWIATELGDRLAHGETDDVCPPERPEGFATCDDCAGAYPVADLTHVDKVQPLRLDGSGGFGQPETFLPLGSEPPARHIRLTRDEWLAALSLTNLLPLGTLGIVTDGELFEKWHAWLLCPGCLDKNKVSRSKRATQARAEGSGSGYWLSKVTTDEPGMSKEEIMAVWRTGDTKTRTLLARFVESGDLVVTEVPTAAGGARQKRYRRPS